MVTKGYRAFKVEAPKRSVVFVCFLKFYFTALLLVSFYGFWSYL